MWEPHPRTNQGREGKKGAALRHADRFKSQREPKGDRIRGPPRSSKGRRENTAGLRPREKSARTDRRAKEPKGGERRQKGSQSFGMTSRPLTRKRETEKEAGVLNREREAPLKVFWMSGKRDGGKKNRGSIKSTAEVKISEEIDGRVPFIA